MADEQYKLGIHEATINALVTDMRDVKGDVAWIKSYLTESRAERRVERRIALWAASVGGAAFAMAIDVLRKKLGL